MTGALRSLRHLVSLVYHADRTGALRLLMLYLVQAVATPTQALWLRAITNDVIAHRGGAAMSAALLLSLFLTARGVGLVAAHAGFTLSDKAVITLNRHIVLLTQRIPGLDHYERPDYQDRLMLLRENVKTLADAVTGAGQAVMVVVQLAVTGVLLTLVQPLMLALIPLAFVWVWLARRGDRAALRARESAAEASRLENHLSALALSPASGKELRVSGLAAEINERASGLWASASRRLLAGDLRSALANTAGVLIFTAGAAGCVAGAVALAVAGRASPGDVVLVLTVSVSVLWQVGSLAVIASTIGEAMHSAAWLRWLEEFSTPSPDSLADSAATPQRLTTGIQVRNLAFRYPGSDRVVLEDVSLDIPAGTTVALVGENGAGKTTLVKLLCGFYQPSAGQITLNGAAIGRMPPVEWLARVTGTFQDFVRYELLVREDVGQGDITRLDDDRVIWQAARRAGCARAISMLPDGLDTPLGRRSGGNGVELSTGQWQKLALARGLLRPEPLLQVLDEPTASLDPFAERALFERYARSAAHARAATNCITLLVSHRFSTIQMADLIVVIDNGRVAEVGTHDQLMRQGGYYAELYSISARD